MPSDDSDAEGCIIEAVALSAGYGDLAAVRDLNLTVHAGEVVAMLGPNGAGKTTTMLTLAGALRPLSGSVRWLGQPTTSPLYERARQGLAFVPEERSVLMRQSVRDNLRLGLGSVDAALEIFPELKRLLDRQGGLLSGGEQQMVTLARALAAKPKLLLVDEMSLGLAPIVVTRLLAAIHSATRTHGLAVLLVEQQARRALEIADRWYVLRGGAIVAEGTADSDHAVLEQLYFSNAVGT